MFCYLKENERKTIKIITKWLTPCVKEEALSPVLGKCINFQTHVENVHKTISILSMDIETTENEIFKRYSADIIIKIYSIVELQRFDNDIKKFKANLRKTFPHVFCDNPIVMSDSEEIRYLQLKVRVEDFLTLKK